MTFEELGFRQKLYEDKNYFEYEKAFIDDAGNDFLHHIIIDGTKDGEVACYDSTLDDGFTCGSNLTFGEALAVADFLKNNFNMLLGLMPTRPRIFAKG